MKRTAVLLLLLASASACNRPASKPDFVIRDDKGGNHAMAFYMDRRVAERYEVTLSEYEKAFRLFSEGAGRAVAAAVASMFSPDDDSDAVPQNDPPELGISAEAFVEIFNTTRVEEWEYRPDGTHAVLRELPVKQMSLPEGRSQE